MMEKKDVRRPVQRGALGLLLALLVLAGCGRAGSAPPPLPGTLVYMSNERGTWDLYRMPADRSTAPRPILATSADEVNPALAPDGKLAFASDREGDLEIYVKDGVALRRVTRSPGLDLSPAWSADGLWLAFVSQRDGDDEVYVAAADGAGLRRLTERPGYDGMPTWSPDGRWIAYVAEEAGQARLYRIPPAGGPRELLLDFGPGGVYDPAWSPDGRYIAFESRVEGQMDLFLLEVETGEVRRLTETSWMEGLPAWSPDGRYLAYVADPDDNVDLYVLAVEGGGPWRLTRSKAEERWPTWGP